MQSSLVVWTPTKSSSAVDLVNEGLTANENFVTPRLLVSSDEQDATEASSGELELELAAMQACYVQLKELVPTVPLNAELSSLQLLQHVIDYIVDLELALHTSASASSSPQRHQQQQQPASSASCSRTTTIHDNVQQSSSTVASTSSTIGRNGTSMTAEISHNSPRSNSRTALRDIVPFSS